MDTAISSSAAVRCPRQVKDTEYVWHPQPNAYERAHINVYVSENGKLRSAAIRDVIRSESGNELIWIESTLSQNIMQLHIPTHELFAMTERRLIFICGPRDLVLSDTLQRHLDSLNGFGQMQALPWTSNIPLAHEMSKIGHGIGIFFLYSGSTHLPLQGCGSRPSPLFAVDNEVTVDPVTGTRSCVADPMSKSRIGFVCEGRLEPDDCMKSLIDKNGVVVSAPPPDDYWRFKHRRPWVIAKYFERFALPPFSGECRYIDPQTGAVKAKIEIRSKTDYVCDIASMIERNRSHPIRGPWCSVVLHPGSTLAIRFPVEGVVTEPFDKDSPFVLPSQRPPRYLLEPTFRGKNVTALRQLTRYDNIYGEVMYHKAIAGDALEWDISQMSVGEVKLKYHADKPLALIEGLGSFVYHWTMTSTNGGLPEEIRAIVNVTFAFTHRYRAPGCDRESETVFDSNISKWYCSTKRMGNGIGDVYECPLLITGWESHASIYCRPDEELFPANCESTGYDLYNNSIVPSPKSVRTRTPRAIPGFQALDIVLGRDEPLSFACICVDRLGYETSKLVIENNQHQGHNFLVRRKEGSQSLFAYRLLPWSEFNLSGKWTKSPISIVLNNTYKKSIELDVGTTLSLRCGFDPELLKLTSDLDRKHLIWLPERPEGFYYTVNYTPNGPEFIRNRYEDSMAATQGGLDVVYQAESRNCRYSELTIKTRRSAILISKDPRHTYYIPMTFICGKTPEPSDLLVSVNAATSNANAIFNLKTIGYSTRYTWDVVEVNVETTDPYMQGCGVTYASDELFKPETPRLYDDNGDSQFGCKIDLHAAREAAFYCPAPYLLDPPNCFKQVLVNGLVKNIRELSQSLVASRSNHFVILSFERWRVGSGEKLRHTPPLECRCVTIKGAILSTIQIENYYST
ncbi:hypothetical protein, conserved [Babesia ovata]|uniref:6-Cys domain-containing protein n=1 Tax=Babesia ovata TaxID=189622 RepID=A0A2H6KD95_9APIC|nr:uncharacterized protein BOVATA_024550 [Babesia ovata]GBE60962.1 hypothetical protein, conserved [Babesia ovata]